MDNSIPKQKPTRGGKRPGSGRPKSQRKLVKFTTNIFADQLPITGEEVRKAIDAFFILKKVQERLSQLEPPKVGFPAGGFFVPGAVDGREHIVNHKIIKHKLKSKSPMYTANFKSDKFRTYLFIAPFGIDKNNHIFIDGVPVILDNDGDEEVVVDVLPSEVNDAPFEQWHMKKKDLTPWIGLNGTHIYKDGINMSPNEVTALKSEFSIILT